MPGLETGMETATLTSRGRVTIPAALRRKLGFKAGSKVEFAENEAGDFVMRLCAGDVRDIARP